MKKNKYVFRHTSPTNFEHNGYILIHFFFTVCAIDFCNFNCVLQLEQHFPAIICELMLNYLSYDTFV